MVEDFGAKLLNPVDEVDRAALACLLRLRSEGCDLTEIADRLRAETGFELSPALVVNH